MRVVSRVAMVKRLEAGERPSYGRRRALDADATVATIPIGYADGVARRLPAVGGAVLTAEEWADRLGTINYEIVCDFGPRLPRRYVRGGT